MTEDQELEYQQELAELETKVDDLESDLSTANETIDEKDGEIERLTSIIEDAKSRLGDL